MNIWTMWTACTYRHDIGTWYIAYIGIFWSIHCGRQTWHSSQLCFNNSIELKVTKVFIYNSIELKVTKVFPWFHWTQCINENLKTQVIKLQDKEVPPPRSVPDIFPTSPRSHHLIIIINFGVQAKLRSLTHGSQIEHGTFTPLIFSTSGAMGHVL